MIDASRGGPGGLVGDGTMSYPIVQEWMVRRAEYAERAGQWFVRADYGDGAIESEESAAGRGRGFPTRREAKAWVADHLESLPA